jgi:hypothetical protein
MLKDPNVAIIRDETGQPTSLALGSTLEQEFAWQIRMLQLPTPVFQYRFLPPRRFRFDVAYPDLKLAVELNGATWVQGRHTRGQGAASDAEKLSLAAIHGWCVLVAVAEHVRDGRAVKWLEEALQRRKAV